MHISTVSILPMVTDRANIAIANELEIMFRLAYLNLTLTLVNISQTVTDCGKQYFRREYEVIYWLSIGIFTFVLGLF